MDDELLDDVLRSLKKVPLARGSCWSVETDPGRVRPILEEIVNRLRKFGYEDEHIRTVLIPGG